MITLRVLLRLLPVHTAVDLYEQACGVAVEIGDEAVDHLLAPEVIAMQLVCAQVPP